MGHLGPQRAKRDEYESAHNTHEVPMNQTSRVTHFSDSLIGAELDENTFETKAINAFVSSIIRATTYNGIDESKKDKSAVIENMLV
ncbi:hypothetical protein NPIL_57421 [Nephila pilipes]|uniref:Uncharacterized protein n=1 Tax=Nephila pilipes TaxID=299642 RepID=A0A8X6NGD4_NEPPI|nr:hypothetical protein NPIL_57421 [Nephila pilipes]